MLGFGNILKSGISIAATLASAFSPKPLRSAASFAPTPRKPEFKAKRKIASARRAKARADAENRFYKQLSKEREIGIDPIHLHGSRDRKEAMRPAWLKKSREWDQRNAGGPSRG